MTSKKLHKIITILREYYSNFHKPSVTQVSQKFSDPFFVLMSCILSLRTKDKTTNEASARLFSKAKSLSQLAKLKTRQIEKLIYPVGFYRTKAKRIKSMSKDMLKRFNGKVPNNMEDLLSLKGVGRKTANLVLTLGYNKQGICVDTHVHRISNRLGMVKTKTPFDTEMELRKKLPSRFWIEYNDLLVAFGQNICKPISPLCSFCLISPYCPKIQVKSHR